MGKLEGKIAVVTGGNSGIGLATAQHFKAEGATVIVTARNAERLQESKEAVGEGIEMVVADVAKMDELSALFEHVGSQHGQIDILFVNAGIPDWVPFESVDEALLDNIMAVNFKGAFFSVQKALPWLKEGSSVIFNTSIANAVGLPNTTVYSASKAALRSLTRNLAVELSPRGIRVNAVSPGPIETPILGKSGLGEEDIESFKQGLQNTVLLQRIGTPKEIATTVSFLACEDSSFITGEEIVVDGGLSQT